MPTQRKKILPAILLILMLLLSSCSSDTSNIKLPSDIMLAPGESGSSAAIESEPADEREYSYTIDISGYLQYIAPENADDFAILVNKQNTVDRDYAPDELATLDNSLTLYGKEITLDATTAHAVRALLLEMRACGFNNVFVTSGYRSYEYQSVLYNTYFAEEKQKHPTWSNEQLKAEVLTYSAYPGTSEHQTGLCLDLYISPGMTELVNYGSETEATSDIGFAETEEYQWLINNAHKFGFILRFGKDKVDLTGYSYESWHYRFVGREAATYIYENGLCYEEYLTRTNG